MSDTDQMIDDAELRELRAAFSSVSLPDAPPLGRITARGDARRRRRRYAVAVASAGGATVATVVAASALGTGDGRVPPTQKLAAIRTSAYTLVSNADGTATLTINPDELFDPARLQSDLERYGIPAKVTVGSICSTDPEPAAFAQVYSFDPGPPGGDAAITIDPAAMPAGTEVSVGQVQLRGGVRAAQFNLIDTSSFTCSDSLPTDTGPTGTPDERPGRGAGLGYYAPGDSGASSAR